MKRAYVVMSLQEKCTVKINGIRYVGVDFKEHGDSVIGFMYVGTNRRKLTKAFPNSEIQAMESAEIRGKK